MPASNTAFYFPEKNNNNLQLILKSLLIAEQNNMKQKSAHILSRVTGILIASNTRMMYLINWKNEVWNSPALITAEGAGLSD